MMKKLSLFIVFGLAVALALNFTFNNSKPRNIAYPDTKITGSETPMYKTSGVVINSSSVKSETYMADSVTLVAAVETGGMSIYDLQSNGVPQHCAQDQTNPLRIHTVMIVNQTPGIPGADRRVSYFFSSNGGVSFDYLGDVPENTPAGFPAMDVLSNGAAIVTNHTTAGGGNQRTQVFADAGPGNGVFTRLDPGGLAWHSATTQPIWPSIIATKSINDPVKFVFVASRNMTPTAADTVAYYNRGLSITTSSFSGYQGLYNVNNANTYNFARSAAGKIGLVYIVNDAPNPLSLGGDVQFMESNDNGVTWTAPVTVLDAVPAGAEVYGALRGVDVAYMGETPKVVMEYIRQDPVASTYYPGLGSKILFWSPNVNGGNFVVVADSATHPQFGNPNGGATDVYTPICRPTIGVSSDNNMLFCAFEVSRADTDAIGSHFYDVFLMNSPDGGATWRQPTRITNRTGPVRDYRFVSMSPWNHTAGAPTYTVNMVYQKDSIPGSVTQTPPAAESMARQVFAKVTYVNLIGIKNIGTETPNGFVLHQNYPNPFNPVTNIRFEIPVSSNVELKLYNSAGQLVGTLLNENVSAGIKEYRLDASALSSGIYFYTIKAGNFTDTKKMILVK